MTEKNQGKPAGARLRRGQRRRSGRRRARRMRRAWLAAAAGLLLLAALVCLGVFWLWGHLHPPAAPELYPVKYEAYISQYAEANDLSPAYVAAVILAESSYNPEAVSYAGARGLMQLMPETARDIAGWLDEEYDWDGLFDPETNIRYGSRYLGYLMRRYDGDMRCASSAYHQGPGTVDRWLSDPQYSEDGQTLAVIASDVTSTYVGRVLKYYEKYAEIYAEQL